MLGFEGLNGRKVKFERLQKGVKKINQQYPIKTPFGRDAIIPNSMTSKENVCSRDGSSG